MMCAFMTPVLKNDWEVYKTKTKRSRSTSETSSVVSVPANQRSRHRNPHMRGIGDTGRSFSYHAPMHGRSDVVYVGSPPKAYHMSHRNSRCASRASIEPLRGHVSSPPKSPTGTKSSNGPSKSPSSASLTKFHNKVMDKLKNVLHRKDNNSSEEEHNQEEESISRGQS